MTDLEMTKLCAEAMGWALEPYSRGWRVKDGADTAYIIAEHRTLMAQFDPLHDDAQAMALVKKFGLNITGHSIDDGSTKPWCAWLPKPVGGITEADDLNRAIVETVAKMQASKL